MSQYDATSANAQRAAANTVLDTGAANASVRIMAGATIIKTITLQATSMGTPSSGTSTFNPPDGEASWVGYQFTPDNNGTIDKVDLLDGDGTIRERATVSTIAAGTGEWQFDTLTASTSNPKQFTQAPTATVPNTTLT